MTSVLRHSHFKSDPWGDGGSKRTAQISEILEDHNLNQEWYQPDITQIFKRKFSAVEGLRLLQTHKIQTKFSKTALTQLGFNYYKRLKTMAHYAPNHRLLLWESSRQQNYLMSYAAQEAGISVIALPHNLESLVPGQKSDFTGKFAPDWLDEELNSLRQCQHIFTISREEQYLLRLFGITADFLPYYPPRPVVKFLEEIRQNRQPPTTTRRFLLLGTAGNKPTEDGMLDRISFFHSRVNDPHAELIVAGFLTERLKSQIPQNPRIHFLGTLSTEDLAKVLVECTAAWIHQPLSTGALTKIPELMIAGIPLILNSDSARSYHNLPGLMEYDNDRDCLKIFQNQLEIPQKPEKPIEFEEQFVQTIRSFQE
jgi:hypothetical protein